RDHDEIRDVNVVIAEDFLRCSLVLAKDKSGRAATGERHALHLQERRDVLVESAVVLELIREIENHIRPEALHLLPEQIEVVKDGEMLRRMTECAEVGE